MGDTIQNLVARDLSTPVLVRPTRVEVIEPKWNFINFRVTREHQAC